MKGARKRGFGDWTSNAEPMCQLVLSLIVGGERRYESKVSYPSDTAQE